MHSAYSCQATHKETKEKQNHKDMDILQAFRLLLSDYFQSLETPDGKWADFQSLVDRITSYHQWFTPSDVNRRLKEILQLLETESHEGWVCPIAELAGESNKRIGVLLRGAIPLEGIEDLLAIVCSGNRFIGKSLEKTDKVLAYLIKRLCAEDARWADFLELAEDAPMRKLDGIIIYQPRTPSAVLHAYTDRLPHLVRPYRKSAAILLPSVSLEGLEQVGALVLNYFGRSPLSVSKLFVPEGFDVKRIYEAIEPMNQVMQHYKYANNFQYHQFVYLMNKIPFLDNGFLLLKEDDANLSPTGVLFYEYYTDIKKIDRGGFEKVYGIG